MHLAQLCGIQRTLKVNREYFAKTEETAITLEGYQCRLDALLPLWDRHQTYFTPLYPCLDEDEQKAQEEESKTFTTEYFNLIAMLQGKIRLKKNELIAADASSRAPPIPPTGASVRTPKIELPTFDGSSDQWIKFRDMFESLIHSKTNLSNIEKFSYLQSSIKLPHGQSNVLDMFKICEDDYLSAWQAVCERYNDKRKIIAMHCSTLFNVPKMSCESASELRRIIDAFSSQISAMKQLGYALGEHDDFANMIVVQFALVRLDDKTLREWKKFHTADSATWKELCEFLTAQWRSLDDGAIKNFESSSDVKVVPKSVKTLVVSSSVETNNNRSSNVKCPNCLQSHFLWTCSSFIAMNIDDRQKCVRDKGLCLNCFSPSHQVRQCGSSYKCKTCNLPHHTLLHFDRSSPQNNNSDVSSTNATAAPTTSTLSANSKPFEPFSMTKKTNDSGNVTRFSTVSLLASEAFLPRKHSTFLSTVIVEVLGEDGNFYDVRALLDNGSDDNLMTTQLARRLGIECKNVCIPLTGICERTSFVHHQTTSTIRSRYGNFQKTLEFSVMPSITSNVPSQSINISQFNIPDDLFLADSKFNLSSKVDMLLNIDIFYQSLLEGKVELNHGPKMLHTTFGWIVGGSTNLPSSAAPKTLLSKSTQALRIDEVSPSKYRSGEKQTKSVRRYKFSYQTSRMKSSPPLAKQFRIAFQRFTRRRSTPRKSSSTVRCATKSCTHPIS